MAVGLGLLGRGGTRQALGLWALHMAGAALAGALLGGLVGGAGALLGLAAWRPWIVGGGDRQSWGGSGRCRGAGRRGRRRRGSTWSGGRCSVAAWRLPSSTPPSSS